MGGLSFLDLFLIVTLLFPLVALAAGLGTLAVYVCYVAIRDRAAEIMGDGHFRTGKAHH